MENAKNDVIRNSLTYDETLKHKNLDLYYKVLDYYLNNNLAQAFQGLYTLYNHITAYNYENKYIVLDLLENTYDYFNDLNTRAYNQKDLIQLRNTEVELKEAIKELLRYYPVCMNKLNLWFKQVKIDDDYEISLSLSTFGDELSTYKEKYEKLLALDNKTILKMITKNDLHDLYAKALYEGLVKND